MPHNCMPDAAANIVNNAASRVSASATAVTKFPIKVLKMATPARVNNKVLGKAHVSLSKNSLPVNHIVKKI